FILKEEQRNAIKAFVNRKHVFAFLPTGSGKSLIYQLPNHPSMPLFLQSSLYAPLPSICCCNFSSTHVELHVSSNEAQRQHTTAGAVCVYVSMSYIVDCRSVCVCACVCVFV